MLRKTNSQKGFTIIEVVITIAIGAAVMALVLNAVAGARRSQRNNARSADVNSLAAAANQYIATRNKLPATRADIKGIADDFTKLGHYVEANINKDTAWDGTDPAAAGDFAWDSAYTTAPSGGNMLTDGNHDYLMVVNQAGCDGTKLKSGGIREMAIAYSLEGQTALSCIEI